ncbi:hypothetical protein P3L10_011819 [Capsicum annuum]
MFAKLFAASARKQITPTSWEKLFTLLQLVNTLRSLLFLSSSFKVPKSNLLCSRLGQCIHLGLFQ